MRARRSSSGGVWLVLEDVSELRRLQQIRTEFIDNLSHELRTPLTTVSLLAETLTRDADAAGDAIPAKMRDRIGKIEVETGHLVQMVSELLDLSRIESGGTIQAGRPLDLGQIAAESAERLRLFADRQGVVLRVDVPSACRPVLGDAARLGQVYVNLLHNAVKFSPDGGDVTVTRARPRTVGSCSAIADHGVGIPRAAQARIFERFYKVDRARVRGETGRHGPRSGDRPPHHRPARRHDLGRVDRGRRFDLLVRPADRRDTVTRSRRGGPMDTLHVATLNIRNMADRWAERLPLLLADMAALQPDVLGLQEVVYPMQQDRLIGAAGEGRYEASPRLGRAPGVRQQPARPGAARGGSTRAARPRAQAFGAPRDVVPAGSGRRSWSSVTHLHHEVPDAAERDEQVAQLLDWLGTAPATDAQSSWATSTPTRTSRRHARMRADGYRSALRRGQRRGTGRDVAVGHPGARRWTRTARPACLDYIWVRGRRQGHVARGSPSIDPRSTTRRSTRAITSACRPSWRSAARSARIG